MTSSSDGSPMSLRVLAPRVYALPLVLHRFLRRAYGTDACPLLPTDSGMNLKHRSGKESNNALFFSTIFLNNKLSSTVGVSSKLTLGFSLASTVLGSLHIFFSSSTTPRPKVGSDAPVLRKSNNLLLKTLQCADPTESNNALFFSTIFLNNKLSSTVGVSSKLTLGFSLASTVLGSLHIFFSSSTTPRPKVGSDAPVLRNSNNLLLKTLQCADPTECAPFRTTMSSALKPFFLKSSRIWSIDQLGKGRLPSTLVARDDSPSLRPPSLG
ncbi:Peroxidase 51 [Senna tora]|uniref:Peroxidase 51 n=1 Tax=Senna tora TaxID=362788 RepID=A0A835C5X6_9FABA|nr:Peroxidase 51 [Senna tora]